MVLELPYEDPEEEGQDPDANRHVQDQWLVEACAQQADLDEGVLRKAFSIAVQEMVDEQDCYFIAKGLCHLCGVSENHFVPVVNFCPDANAGHSLCREHLRSIYRVRTEDLFAGRNRPMASRRALKCMVCSRTCPCSMCVLEKNHEINRYRRWLREEQQLARSGNGFEGSSAQPRAGSTQNDAPPLEDEFRRRVDVQQLAGNQDSSQSGQYYSGDSALSMQAEDKSTTPISARGPKRAAKETLPPLRLPSMEAERQQPPASLSSRFSNENGRGRSAGSMATSAPVPSPSASHVINCAESEKSLVQLLTTLNQSSAGDRSTPEAKPQRTYEASARDSTPSESRQQQKLIVDTRLANDDVPSARSSERTVKRKRVIQERGDSVDDDDDDDDGYELVESPGGILVSSRSGRTSRKPREDYSSEDDAPLWPPRASKDAARGSKSSAAKKPGRPKTIDSANADEDRTASLRASPPSSSSSASRKRKSSNTELEMASVSERKNPRSLKSSPPKPSTKDPRAAGAGKVTAELRSGVQQHRHHQDADEEESDIDTNLDYCEVCLAMGDLVCCDVCPRSFHLACLGMKESDLPEGDWQCDECKKPSHFEAFARKVDIQPSVFTKCAQIVKCLKEHPFSKPFLTPVGDVPHYRDIVQQPMDLSTVASKLKRNAYAVGSATKGLNLDAFANDVRLIWSNCKLFNDDGSGITRAADELAAGFEKLLNQVKKKLPPVTMAVAPTPASAKAEEQADRVDPQAVPSPVSSVETATKLKAEGEKVAADKDEAANKASDQAAASSTEPTAPRASESDESGAASATAPAADTSASDDTKG